MPKKKVTTALVLPEVEDKLAKFRVTDDTLAVRYAGQVWRVRKQTKKLLAISRGSGEREEFLWVHREVVTEVPPPKPKKPRKTKATKKAPAKKAAPKKPAKKAVTPKKVTKKTTPKRGSVRKKK